MNNNTKKIVIAIPHTGTIYSDVALSLLKIQSKHAINIQMLKSSILYISREYLVSFTLYCNSD